MRHRRLGHSDLVVSEVGFGTWTLVTDWWGRTDDPHEMIRAALDAAGVPGPVPSSAPRPAPDGRVRFALRRGVQALPIVFLVVTGTMTSGAQTTQQILGYRDFASYMKMVEAV